MKATSIYPVLMSTDVAKASAFFVEHLGFQVVFQADWYVSMRLDSWELAVLDPTHESVPESHRGPSAAGVIVNVEVGDVDAAYDELVRRGSVRPLQALRSESFGQRHFILAGPDGVLVDVIQPIEPDAETAAGFVQGGAAVGETDEGPR